MATWSFGCNHATCEILVRSWSLEHRKAKRPDANSDDLLSQASTELRGSKHLEMETPFESAEALRDHLIELISVRNLRHRPEALFALFRQFLQRLTLPGLCHFLDLVLPQLTPVRAPWAGATRTLWTCHHIRATSHDNGYPCQPKVSIAYFFTSHDNIHHVRVFWGTLPLLLFSDPRMAHPVDVNQFQGQAAHRLHQQHIQLGLRKGMTVLVYYRV